MSIENCSIELLESKLNVSELEKVRLEDENKALKQKNDDLGKSLVNFKKEEEEKVEQLMIENRVLECEKKKAESEVEAWMAKCNQLEIRVLELQKQLQIEKMKKGIDIEEIDSANMNDDKELGNQSGSESRDRKHIDVTTEEGQHRNVSPLTTGVKPSVDVTDISDSDDNMNLSKTGKRKRKRKRKVPNRVTSDSADPVDISDSDSDNNLKRSKSKKRRVTNRVTSDSDDPVDPVDVSDSNKNQNRSKIKKKRVTRATSDSDDSFDPIDISDGDDNQNRSKTKKKRITKRATRDSDDPVNPVDVSNNDDNLNRSKTRKRKVPNRVTSDSEGDDPVDTSDRGGNLNLSKARKRKVTNKVISDGESDDDVPLSKLRSTNQPANNVDTELTSSMNDSVDENVNRSTCGRRLIKRGKKGCEISKFMNDDDNEKDEDDLETDSLDDFIVDGSDASEDHSASDCKEISENEGISSGESQNESENSMEYGELMSSLRRKKKQKVVWEYQADMLADFGKNSELCMEAVCAMCRHDTKNGELKGQGFNMYDGKICYELALFMTGGNLDGEVKKTVEELEDYKPGGTRQCRKYATKYSGQLYEVYKNEEDPYFHVNHLVSILNKNI